MSPRARLRLRCPACGPVRVEAPRATVHHNRRDGFRLLQADCRDCGQLLITATPAVLDRALAAGACRRELLPPAPPLDDADLGDLHLALADEDWCAWLAGGDVADGWAPA